MTRRWLWQAALWSLWSAISLTALSTSMTLSSAAVFLIVLVALGLWGASESLRALVLRRHWLELPGVAVAWRIGALVPLLALAVQLAVRLVGGAVVALGWVSFAPGTPEPHWGTYFQYVVNTMILLYLWSGVWLATQLFGRWRHGEIAKWQAEAAQRQLEMELLRAQLNPHFVFNALNNVRALVLEDPQRAREMLTHLSNSLRYTLSHSQSERVPLDAEIAVVRDYLALQQLHHEEKLSVHWQVDPATQGCSLPPMVLQLLVENAIKHGIAQTPGGGRVDIAIGRSGDALRLEVSNPGRWLARTGAALDGGGHAEPRSPATVGGGRVAGGLATTGNVAASGSMSPGSGLPGTTAEPGGIGLENLRQQVLRVGGPTSSVDVSEAEGRVGVRVIIAP